jgi:DNA helicase-2/ATP-dependent DNA helicase PcrA
LDLNRDLSPDQRRAVVHPGGPLLVLSGAGSGKTRVLTYRIAHLVQAHGVPPHRILAVTFTNRAAREMRERVERLLGRRAEGLWIGTFHAMSARLLRRYGERIGVPSTFLIFDERDTRDLVAECMGALGIPEQLYPARALAACLDEAKNRGEGPAEYARKEHDVLGEKAARLYPLYQKRLCAQGALDFGDLILKACELVSPATAGSQEIRTRFSHLLVDEFQDTNRAQYRLLRRLAQGGASVTAVGDDDQSIYGWRGADIRNILEFERDFPGVTVVRLGQNYRSSAAIVAAAAAVVSHNRHRHTKRLWTENPEGERPVYVRCRDERDEAKLVAQAVARLSLEQGFSYGECAIFFRTNAQSRVLEDALRERRIPHVVVGGVRFYERKEVRDLLAYLRLAASPKSDVDFRRVLNVPARGLGAKALESIEARARELGGPLVDAARDLAATRALPRGAASRLEGFVALLDRLSAEARVRPVGDLLRFLLEETGYRRMLLEQRSPEARGRLENVEELVSAAQEFESQSEDASLAAFLEGAALVADIDLAPAKGDAVSLMTLHSAKGLEFRAVFLTGLEEGTFPHARSSENEWELEEERRLCYVGITRAREILCLTSAASRRLFGEPKLLGESRFVAELGDHVERESRVFSEVAESDLAFWQRPRRPAAPLPGGQASRRRAREDFDQRVGVDYDLAPQGLRPGMRVAHAFFGEGRIQSLSGVGERARLLVLFDDGTERKIVARYVTVLGY